MWAYLSSWQVLLCTAFEVDPYCCTLLPLAVPLLEVLFQVSSRDFCKCHYLHFIHRLCLLEPASLQTGFHSWKWVVIGRGWGVGNLWKHIDILGQMLLCQRDWWTGALSWWSRLGLQISKNERAFTVHSFLQMAKNVWSCYTFLEWTVVNGALAIEEHLQPSPFISSSLHEMSCSWVKRVSSSTNLDIYICENVLLTHI